MSPIHVPFGMAAFALALWGADAWLGISARVAAREAVAAPVAAPAPATTPAPAGCKIEDWVWTVDDGWLEIEGVLKNYGDNRRIVINLYEGNGADGQRGRYLGNEQAHIFAGGTFRAERPSNYAGDKLAITYACQ